MWLKVIPYLAVAAFAFLGGLTFQSKVLQPKIVIPACPVCPPQTSVDLQSFDVTKIKNVKSFTYSPSISGNITVVVDTTTYKKFIK